MNLGVHENLLVIQIPGKKAVNSVQLENSLTFLFWKAPENSTHLECQEFHYRETYKCDLHHWFP